MLLARRPPAFDWRTLRESEGEETGDVEGQPEAREGAEGEDTEWADGGKEVWRRELGESAVLVDEGLDCTMEVYMSEESKERVTVLRVGT